jgi:uncharacterized membrane protein
MARDWDRKYWRTVTDAKWFYGRAGIENGARFSDLRNAASSLRIVGTLGRTSAVRRDLGEAASRRSTVQTNHLQGDGKMAFKSHAKSAVKAISWRIVGAIDTFVLAFFVTGHMGMASAVVGFEVITKSFLYYGHERVWEIEKIKKVFAAA